jgi:hypothetical protein
MRPVKTVEIGVSLENPCHNQTMYLYGFKCSVRFENEMDRRYNTPVNFSNDRQNSLVKYYIHAVKFTLFIVVIIVVGWKKMLMTIYAFRKPRKLLVCRATMMLGCYGVQ